MQTVTKVMESRGLVTLYLDERRWLVLRAAVYETQPLREGEDIDPDVYEAELSENAYPLALDSALKFLAARARSTHEVTSRLEKAGYPPTSIERVLAKLSEYKLLDDEKFAQDFTAARSTRLLGKHRIAQELRQKGIAQDVATEALETIDEDQAFADAVRLAERLAKRQSSIPANIARQKVSQALARRGYDWDMVRRAVTHVFQKTEDDFQD